MNSESCIERNVSFFDQLVTYLVPSVSVSGGTYGCISLSLSLPLPTHVLCHTMALAQLAHPSCRHSFYTVLLGVNFEKKTLIALRQCSTGDKIPFPRVEIECSNIIFHVVIVRQLCRYVDLLVCCMSSYLHVIILRGRFLRSLAILSCHSAETLFLLTSLNNVPLLYSWCFVA